MLLVIDNYDSFTWNLVHYIGEAMAAAGHADPASAIRVERNDALSVAEALALKPAAILLSPGPGAPSDAGICVELIKAAADEIPILGVCLGHQAIGEAFGGTVVRAEALMHGKTSPIRHQGRGLFQDVPDPFTATRYHSLTVRRDDLPETLQVTAATEDGVIMGLAHKGLAVEGVQFHPESIATEHGRTILTNFLRRAELLAPAPAPVAA